MYTNLFDIRLISGEQAAANRSKYIEYYTIFNPQNVFRPNPIEILELAEALGDYNTQTVPPNRVSNMVCYLPEREALHWTAVYTKLLAQVEGEEHFEKLVGTLYRNYVLPHLDLDSIKRERKILESQIRTAVEQISSGFEPKGALGNEVNLIFQKVAARHASGDYNPGQWLEGETIKEAVIKIATDRLYNSSPDKRRLLKETILTQVLNAARLGMYKPLTPCTDGYQSIIISAAPGSGKSTLSDSLSAYLSHIGRGQNDFCLLCRDDFRRLMINEPEEASRVVGSTTLLAVEETTEVVRKMEEAYHDVEIINGGEMPLIFAEKNTPHDYGIIDRILEKADKVPTYNYIIQLPADEALRRAFKRATTPDKLYDKGKFFSPEIVLTNHAKMSEQFESTLEAMSGKHYIFELLDSNIERGKPLNRVAFGDMERKEINVLMPLVLREYLAKRYINTKANNETEISNYPEDYAIRISNVLMNISTFSEINFADPNTQEIYATLKNSKLEIYNEVKYATLLMGIFPSLDNCKTSMQSVSASSKLINHTDYLPISGRY